MFVIEAITLKLQKIFYLPERRVFKEDYFINCWRKLVVVLKKNCE